MNDAAFILGDSSQRDAPAASGGLEPSKAMRMMDVSKDVQQILSGNQDKKSATLPPIVPTFTQDTSSQSGPTKVKIGTKIISSDKPARKWTWASFASSSRPDGALFNHWVRADVEYTDYPYAKFDIHLEQVMYTEEEYSQYLKSDEWTKSETDYLMELAGKYDLRWPVIHDRWFDYYHSAGEDIDLVARSVEDLQERYYSVAATLSQARISQIAAEEAEKLAAIVPDQTAPDAKERTEAVLLQTAAAKALAASHPKSQPLINTPGTGTSNKMFDVEHERERREHLDRMWRRSKEEEEEEMRLRQELKLIETKLRKIKKMGGHIAGAVLPAAAAASRVASAASSRNVSRSQSPVPGAAVADTPALLDQSFSSTAPLPMPQNPYLQSGRLIPPATGGPAGINKTLLNKMDQMLKELNVSPKPVPTRRVCDLYDSVRKDILSLITLKKLLMQKEGTLHGKRVKLAKLRGGDTHVPDEEALLGIVVQPPPAPAAPAPAKGSKAKAGGKSKAAAPKSKAGAQPKAGGQKGAQQKAKADEAGKTETPGTGKKKPAAKRKRKAADTKTPPAGAAATVAAAPTAIAPAVASPPAVTAAAAAAAAAALKVAPTPAATKAAAKAATKAAPVVAAAAAVATPAPEAKPPAKKRARKSPS